MSHDAIPSKKGSAKVEFLALREETANFLRSGHSIAYIHRFYTEKGCVTTSYTMFYRYTLKYFPKLIKSETSLVTDKKEISPEPKISVRQEAAPTAETKQGNEPTQLGVLNDNKVTTGNIDLEDIVPTRRS